MSAICLNCRHPESHHEAGECWTDADGNETHDDGDCRCGWYEPIQLDGLTVCPECVLGRHRNCLGDASVGAACGCSEHEEAP